MISQQTVDRWISVREGKEAHGSGTPAQQAERYYFDYLMEQVAEEADRKGIAGKAQAESFELLVSVTGLSPATTILAARVLRPRRLAVVHADPAGAGVEVIRRFTVGAGRGKVAAERFTAAHCDPTDPRRLVRLIGELVGEGGGACVDITGGKKLTSAAAAVAAVSQGCAISYVESTFDPALRLPRPGSEQVMVFYAHELTVDVG